MKIIEKVLQQATYNLWILNKEKKKQHLQKIIQSLIAFNKVLKIEFQIMFKFIYN